MEFVYKRIMNRVIKKDLYQIIQSSVDTIYNIEEDTIGLANNVLDTFILKQIDGILYEEVTIIQKSMHLE
jgi:hypothetical protein